MLATPFAAHDTLYSPYLVTLRPSSSDSTFLQTYAACKAIQAFQQEPHAYTQEVGLILEGGRTHEIGDTRSGIVQASKFVRGAIHASRCWPFYFPLAFANLLCAIGPALQRIAS